MKSSKIAKLILPLGIVFQLGGCATQKACQGSICNQDEATTAEVTRSLQSHPDLGPPGLLQISTKDRTVYLHGIVSTGYQREIAESLAASTPGVVKVINDLSISE
jgi:osmotically-inducible protein OsmY